MSNIAQSNVSTSKTSPSASTIPLEDLRRAAARLTTREAARVFIRPIPKRLVGALIEEAFSADPRGLAYDEEVEDLVRFIASAPPSEDALMVDTTLASAVVALHDWFDGFDFADPEDRALLDVLRATARYFLRIHAVQLAENDRNTLAFDTQFDPSEQT